MGGLDGTIEVLVSVPLMVEYESVMTREEHLRESGLTADEVNAILDAVARIAVRVPLRFLWRPRLMNAADEMVLETAVNGGADRLVTFNLRHLAAAANEFGIPVKTPSEVWKEVRGLYEKK